MKMHPPSIYTPRPAYSPGALQGTPNLHNQYQKLKAESTVYIWKEKHKVTGQHILFGTAYSVCYTYYIVYN